MQEELLQLLKKNIPLLTDRDSRANKGSYGRLLAAAGSPGMAGAAYLASVGAFRTGIGMVKILGPECNREILQIRLPEAMYAVLPPLCSRGSKGGQETGCAAEAENCGEEREQQLLSFLQEQVDWADHLILGPGLSKSAEARKLIRLLWSGASGAETGAGGETENRPLSSGNRPLPKGELGESLRSGRLLVLDADALNLIAELGLEPGVLCPNTVITPHAGEMSRLTGRAIGEIKADPAGIAGAYAAKHGVIVVLKDARSVVAYPDGAQTFVIDSGCGAMAKAGSGDVLCGFIAGICAVMKDNIREAVPAAVWLHGRAGSLAAAELGCHSLLAGDIAAYAGAALRSLKEL